MENNSIKFEDMPRALAYIIEKIDELDRKLESLDDSYSPHKSEWMDVNALCAYLPTHPAKQTVYGWTSAKMIPHYKMEKSVIFLKSEIDKWLKGEQHKSIDEIEAEAEAYCAKKKGHKS